MMYLFLGLLYFYLLGSKISYCNESKSVDEVEEFDKILEEENGLAVLFTEACCACTDCVEAEVLLGGMSKELEENIGIFVLRIKDPVIKSRYGVKKVPALAYIRDNKTAMYDGKFEFETLYFWLQENRLPTTVDLDDTSFEHLTQAATGATTGDWLVLFHDGICIKNRELIHLETAGIKMKNKVNVASVNAYKAPETIVRFKVPTCPHVIFFRHSKMYRFGLPDITSKTLKRFAESFYKNSKAERVPLPPSAFDKFLDTAMEFYFHNWYYLTMSLTLVIVSTAILFMYTLSELQSHKKSD